MFKMALKIKLSLKSLKIKLSLKGKFQVGSEVFYYLRP